MSDSKKIPTPDDFSKTTPNINLPKDSSPQNAWEKTNYNFPAQPPADDWGNTVANIRPIETDENDFGKTYFPSSQKSPQSPEWGMTQANIDLSETDFGGKQNNYGSAGRISRCRLRRDDTLFSSARSRTRQISKSSTDSDGKSRQ